MGQNKSNVYVFIFLTIFVIFFVLVVYLLINKINYNIEHREIYDHNITFNAYDRTLKGSEIISLINYTIDFNNSLIERESEDLVQIEIKLTEEKTIGMETIVKSGIEDFLLYLNDQNFKLIDKKYHDNGKISLLRYELLDINSINHEEEKISI